MTRAGIVTVVGKPNAGKSTLLNRIVGEKLSIVSDKPQSTRDRVVGIRTTDDTQMVVLDTPGLLNPRYELHRAMRATALSRPRRRRRRSSTSPTRPSARRRRSRRPRELTAPPRAPVIPVLNKVDALRPVERDELRARSPTLASSPRSPAKAWTSCSRELELALPEGPFLYPEDEISTQSVRFFVGGARSRDGARAAR